MAPALPLQLFKRACQSTDGYVCYHMPIPAVIGIVCGCAFLLLTGIFITFLCCKCRRHKKRVREEGEAANGGSVFAYNGAKRGERIEFNPNAY